jgi:putative protease
MPELLAPAGTWDCARAAIENGADAIYFGLDRFNARMRAQNFTEADLPELMAFLHRRGVKGYIALNTLIFPRELAAADQYLRTMIAAGVDAVIVQDVGICRLIRHLSPDFPIHASTQMTITSAAGVAFARALGCQLVVLARECSLKDIHRIQKHLQAENSTLPLEVFVHGALCVAYSGQCLTSEALGGRSANRGECAQACRMTYDLVVDGDRVDLGDRQYLLSPQDLAGLPVLPDLVKVGVTCLKIEGRLKTPEYVANVTQVYRQALDRIVAESLEPENRRGQAGVDSLKLGNLPSTYAVSDTERYALEMAFSRGLYTGWFRGINNQELVHARFAKKRGVYLGEVTRVRQQQVELVSAVPVKPGDGVVFDTGHPDTDQGGRIYGIEQRCDRTWLRFGRHDLDWRRIHPGTKLWKTSDPDLDKTLRQSYNTEHPQYQQPIHLEIWGTLGEPMVVLATDRQGHMAKAASTMPLVAAHTNPLTPERLQQQFARLGNTPFSLGTLTHHLTGDLMLPIRELNRLRRQLVDQLLTQRATPKPWHLNLTATYQDLIPKAWASTRPATPPTAPPPHRPTLIALVRTLPQLEAALDSGLTTLYCEFENPLRYRDAVTLVTTHRTNGGAGTRPASTPPHLFLAPPRITKPGEYYILNQVRQAGADGYLIRNYDHLQFFAGERCIGDFSLNIANPITADYFQQEFGLERLTASYDLTVPQLINLLEMAPPDWFEITIHQHMPMFHMEHCVFCAFLSNGTDFTNCGRPCESHTVKLQDRTGTQHVLQADAGCRNTLFNGVAQTGAEFVPKLISKGAGHFRLEFLEESPAQVTHTIHCYQQLLQGDLTGRQLWQQLQLQSQLGVTRGTLDR